MEQKIILDLCGGTGSWSKPYKDAGYEVWNITLPEFNILWTKFRAGHIFFTDKKDGKTKLNIRAYDVYGVLSAPPCTHFSFARTNAKEERNLQDALDIVIGCLKVVWYCQFQLDKDVQKYSPLKFWALENPYYGMLSWFLGKPAFSFDPWEFGDAYKKKTALWGKFNEPSKVYSDIEKVLTKEQIEKHKTNSQELPTLGRGVNALFTKTCEEMGHSWSMKNNQSQCAYCHIKKSDIKKMPKFDYMKSEDIHPEYYKKFDRQARRAITPAGFAKAFFEANK